MRLREEENRGLIIGVSFFLGKMSCSVGTRHLKKVNGEGHFRQMDEQDVMYGGKKM